MEPGTNEAGVPIEDWHKEEGLDEVEVEEDKEDSATMVEEKNLELMLSYFSAGHFGTEKEGTESRMVSRRAVIKQRKEVVVIFIVILYIG